MEGTLEMRVGEQRRTGAPGSVMLVPRGWRTRSLNQARYRCWLFSRRPATNEGFWRAMAEVRARTGGPPDAETLGFATAWAEMAGVTTANLAPDRREEAKRAVIAALWPTGDGPRQFRIVTQFIVGERW